MIGVLEAVALGLVIGAVLGGLGGGGAILTVPALVYVLGQSATEATTGSLVIVGLTALVGVVAHQRSRRVDWRTGLLFGALGLPATWAGSLLNRLVDTDVLMLGFAGLMTVAAAAMLPQRRAARRSHDVPDPEKVSAGVGARELNDPGSPGAGDTRTDDTGTDDPGAPPQRRSLTATAAAALGVGLLTGFFGVGGGFVVVPALVVVLGLPMSLAVGTSLLIVALNSATSLLARAGELHLDWMIVVPFTLAAMVATLLGKRVADRVPADRSRAAFAALLLLVAGYTAYQSVTGLLGAEPGGSSVAAQPAAPPAEDSADEMTTPDPEAAQRAIDDGAVVLDVRTPAEYDQQHVADALNLDLSSAGFDEGLTALDPDADYVVYCASGRRAAEAITRMTEAGVGDALVNGGGIDDLLAVGVPRA